MTDKDGLYTLVMKGEKNRYEFRGSEQHAFGVVCTTLSDMTGYKAAYLREKLAHMKINEERNVDPANGFGGTPTFIIKRVS